MSRYYLMSQLPSLDGLDDNAPLPITEEQFDGLCTELLGKNVINDLKKLTLVPQPEADSESQGIISLWNTGERNLRLALAMVRSAKMGKEFTPGASTPGPDLVQTAQTAVQMDNPMEAELYLNRRRLAFLESLRPMDYFSDDAVIYYGLKLKLLTRMKQFDAAKGEASYRNIYDSIINGDELEDIQ